MCGSRTFFLPTEQPYAEAFVFLFCLVASGRAPRKGIENGSIAP